MRKPHKRTQDLAYSEFVAFVKLVNRYPSRGLAADAFGISRPTLDSILNTGKARKSIIKNIREELNQLQSA